MVFAFAFAFGRHSSAALVHLSFLIALAMAVLSYGRRIRRPEAGVAASLLVYASPLFGVDGTSAYIDVATAAVVFPVFYVLEVWRDRPEALRPLAIAGLLGGFAYAAKYTAFLAVPYAMIYVAWRRRNWRGPAVIAACSLILISPWAIKNTVWVGNPVSPMLNGLFPNPVVSVAFEQEWSAAMRHYNNTSYWQIPVAVTYSGENLTGFFGAAFLLAPLALAALRYPEGRRALLAFVVFAAPYPMNIGARFLIPAMPFLAVAMALGMSRWPAVLAAVAVFHTISSWPALAGLYSAKYSWRIREIPWRAALRIEPEEQFLTRMRPDYVMMRSIERLVPPGERVLTLNGVAEAYTTRQVMVGFQSSSGETLTDMLYEEFALETQPARIVRLRLPSGQARRLRIEQTSQFELYRQWSVHEVRLYHGDAELPRRPEWRLTARPNPWEIQLAFDNSPVTRWRTKETAAPGMYIQIDLGATAAVDRVDVVTSLDCAGAKLRLLEWTGSEWKQAAGQPEILELPPPGFLGRAAMQEWRARNAGYLLFCNANRGAPEILQALPVWGLSLIATHGDCHLLRNDAGMPRLEKGTEWRTTSAWTAGNRAPRR